MAARAEVHAAEVVEVVGPDQGADPRGIADHHRRPHGQGLERDRPLAKTRS